MKTVVCISGLADKWTVRVEGPARQGTGHSLRSDTHLGEGGAEGGGGEGLT